MTHIAPDETATMTWIDDYDDDDAILSGVSTAGGLFKLGAQHWLVKTASATPIIVIKEDGTGTITPKDAGWLFLRDIDISDLAELRAHWLGRPAGGGPTR